MGILHENSPANTPQSGRLSGGTSSAARRAGLALPAGGPLGGEKARGSAPKSSERVERLVRKEVAASSLFFFFFSSLSLSFLSARCRRHCFSSSFSAAAAGAFAPGLERLPERADLIESACRRESAALEFQRQRESFERLKRRGRAVLIDYID